MKRIAVIVILSGVWTGIFAQQAEVTFLERDSAYLEGLPRLTLPPGYASRPLPASKDNSKLTYFPPIYSQEVWNCNQAASVWTLFTYEVNYLRNLSGSSTSNQYSPMAVFNLLNGGYAGNGVSYFDTWEVIRANGIPANPDFSASSQNSQVWMTGYDKYYRGMKNRIDQVYAIDVGSIEGMVTLKHWINDHLNGEEVGGLANFQIGSGVIEMPQIPKGEEGEDEFIITKFDPRVGHAMTFVGWNDAIRYDWNGDGQYTNDRDITGDGVVNLRDWEIGALRVVNSWGTGWADGGKAWVMYRLLAESTEKGGIWDNSVFVVKPKKSFDPQLTIKTRIRYNHRSRLRIRAGIASASTATVPERIMDFSCFSFQGDTLPVQGFYGLNSDLIELGLDITPLLEYFPANGEARIFLDVIQKAPNDRGNGRIEGFSVIDYTHGSHEYQFTGGVQDIADNSLTRLSVVAGATVVRPVILTESFPDAQVGVDYRTQIEYEGQVSPLRFANPATLYQATEIQEYVPMTGGTLVLPSGDRVSATVDLPFAMLFYGHLYDKITIHRNGCVVMGEQVVHYIYMIDNRWPFYQNPGLYPFFGTLYYPKPGMQVTVEAKPEEVVVRWNASTDEAGNQPVTFAAVLFPDGKVSYYFDEMNIGTDITWIAGLSAGNYTDYLLMDYVYTGLPSGSAWELTRYDWPSWLSLSSSGDLRGTPSTEGIWQIPLFLKDGYGVSTSKTLTLKTSGYTGIKQNQDQAYVLLYPNPVQGTVWIELNNQAVGTLTLEILDISGRKMIHKKFAVPGGHERFRCEELAALAPGIYLYRFTGVAEGQGKIVR